MSQVKVIEWCPAEYVTRVELALQAELLSNPASSEGLQLSHWEDTGSQQSRIPQVFIDLAAH